MDELQALLGQIIKRIMKLLTCTGYLIEEQGMSYLAEAESDRALTPLQAAACTYRIALGPRAGQKVLSLQTVPSRAADPTQPGCVNAHGFSLHAGVRCAAHQRQELERLCRYITRPAIASERLKRNQAGQVVLQLKSPYRDGTTHIVMTPLELMQRLAALVPRPRLHLIRFHGVLAPHAKLRAATFGVANQLHLCLRQSLTVDGLNPHKIALVGRGHECAQHPIANTQVIPSRTDGHGDKGAIRQLADEHRIHDHGHLRG